MRVIKPPAPYYLNYNETSVFLAGSIEMGAAEDWQSRVTRELEDIEGLVILNPRGDDWDSSWEQSIHNPKFYEQVSWELDALMLVDWIIMYLAPGTKSPISLLELGMHIGPKMFVCCPTGFWRKGNVDVVCEWYGERPVFEDLGNLLMAFREELGNK